LSIGTVVGPQKFKTVKVMESQIKTYLAGVTIGEPQICQNLVVFPLQAPQNGVMSFITLDEAIAAGSVVVSEISASGSVPQLLVANKGDTAVLFVDGEQLIGAKQNRVLNTSVLVQGKTEAKIPVSCTEQGRWSYNSAHFDSAKYIMAAKARALKSQSVTTSLRSSSSYFSNQAQVWDQVRMMQADARVASPTSSMSDVFNACENKFQDGLAHFICQPGQQGLLVLHNGRVAGLDLVSRSEVYAQLHQKFVRCYLLEPLTDPATEAQPQDPERARDEARNFLDKITHAGEEKFQSAGYGWDFRLRADGLSGNALVAEDHVIHATVFKVRAAGTQPPVERQPAAERQPTAERRVPPILPDNIKP
jgi:hypothetical protein